MTKMFYYYYCYSDYFTIDMPTKCLYFCLTEYDSNMIPTKCLYVIYKEAERIKHVAIIMG